MPQPIVLPRQPNPWQNVLPTLLTNLALAKMQHNWNMDIADKQIKAQQVKLAETRAYETGEKKKELIGKGRRAGWKLKPTAPVEMKDGIAEQTILDPPKGWEEFTGEQDIRWWRPKAREGYEWGEYEQKKITTAIEPKELLARSTTLRKEFSQQSKTFINVRDSYQRILASAKEPSAAGDLALIFNYMKMLDPESVVRESEFATAQNAAGVPARVRALYNKMLRGERMAPVQRKDFVKRAGLLMTRQRQSHALLRKQYAKLAQEYQVPPGQVLIDYRMPFEVGAIYEDANGIKKRYLGIDKGWGAVE